MSFLDSPWAVRRLTSVEGRLALAHADDHDPIERGIDLAMATGDPKSIARGPRFDCDGDITKQAGSPSEERCHNVAKTGVDSGGLQETGGDNRMAGT